MEANSTVIRPLRRPMSTRTRVSNASESLLASSVAAGAVIRLPGAARVGFGCPPPCWMQ